MRIRIAAIGRGQKGAHETQTAVSYLDMAGQLGGRLGIGPLSLHEIEDRQNRSGAGPAHVSRRKLREEELLLAQVPEGAVLVALDGAGRQLSSEAFAAWLGKLRDDGARTLVFAIGGADGLGQNVLASARLVLSLGTMTWPHMLVRVMLAEQIYRAVSILANHPYHRGG